jgi:hypothetical protein
MIKIHRKHPSLENTIGASNKLFQISKNTETQEYTYGVKTWVGVKKICKTKNKSKCLNKYTLNVISVLINMFVINIVFPITFFVVTIYSYFVGMAEFFSGDNFGDHVEVFHWGNVIMLLTMFSYEIFKNIL